MIEQLQQFAGSFPEWAQGLAVALVSAIPFVESYFGAVIGVALGLGPALAVLAAVLGNILSMLGFVLGTDAARQRVRRVRGTDDGESTPRRQRLKRMFDRFGVPGVSLLGQTLLPSQITSAAMVGFGASRNSVIFWQVISIILWGVLFGVLAHLGINLLVR